MLNPDVAFDNYSQFGEDGYIAACIEKIGTKNRWCLEIGANDGRFFSNTLRLREQGWNAILVEADERPYKALEQDFGESSICVHERCTDLDAVISAHCPHRNIDFVSIDIDGQDYWLWHDMEWNRPRIVCIEHSPYLDQARCYVNEPVPRGGPGQTARGPLLELAEMKRYTLQAETRCNLIFIADEEL